MNTSEIVMIVVSAVNIIVVWVVMYVLCNVVTEECGKEPIVPDPVVVHDSVVSDAGAALGIASWLVMDAMRNNDFGDGRIVVDLDYIDYYYGCCLKDRPSIINMIKNILEFDFMDIVQTVEFSENSGFDISLRPEYCKMVAV